MKKSNSATGYSNDHLCNEVLVKVFKVLNPAELGIASMVCKSWNQASRDPSLWNKLDLSRLSSNSFQIPSFPEALKDIHLSTKMTRFLKHALSLSNGNTTCVIFNYYVYLTDEQLITIAQRTPNLERLVLPASGNLSRYGIWTAMRLWRGIKSLTITPILREPYMYHAIGKYCKNISELKLICCFEVHHAEYLVKYTPNLKVLSIRNVMVNMKALCRVLNSLENLEVVNIRHSLIWDAPEAAVVRYNINDLQNHLNDSHVIRKLLFCERESCPRCKNENGRRRHSYGLMEGNWREDEISSLAH